MLVGYRATDQDILEQVVREPRFRTLTTIPLVTWPTLGLLCAAYALIGAGTSLYLSGGPYLLTLVLSSMGCFWAFTPLHDATHRAVSRSPVLNELAGFFGALPLLPGITARIYRYLHLEHHLHTGDPLHDPDEPFVSWKGLRGPLVWLGLDVLWTVWYFRHWNSRPWSERLEFVAGISFYIGVQAVFLASPYAKSFVLLWVIPQRIAFMTIVYFFAHIQHPEGVVQRRHPFQGTVLIEGGALVRSFLLGQNEHLMHHLFPSVPFYRYHDVWKAGRRLFEAQPLIRRGLFTAAPFTVSEPPVTALGTRVASARDAGEGIRAYELVPDGPAPLPAFTAGAHIAVLLGDGLVRQYSLCNAPGETHRYLIAVKKEADGRGGSRRIHETLTEGARVEVGAPRNYFPLDERAADYTLIAGGIGLTPLLSMAHALHARGARFALHVYAKDTAAVPFGAELRELPFARHIHIHTRDTGKPEPGAVLGGYSEGRQVYLCGPTGFMKWVLDAARRSGWPGTAIVTETFTPPPVDPRQNERLEVVLARSGKTLVVEAEQSVLEVLREHRIGVPSNCNQGICGSCMTRVLGGTPEHRDAILTDDERKACDRMLVCVSRARGGRLTLDV